MLESILIRLDGSTRAEAILTELRVLPAWHGSEVILLRVVGELAGAGAGAVVRGGVYEGDPAEAILAGAREQAATLIALTTHGRMGLARWELGSVTDKVLRGSTLPMLVCVPVRASAPEVAPPVAELTHA